MIFYTVVGTDLGWHGKDRGRSYGGRERWTWSTWDSLGDGPLCMLNLYDLRVKSYTIPCIELAVHRVNYFWSSYACVLVAFYLCFK
jgi:hypothetical protein